MVTDTLQDLERKLDQQLLDDKTPGMILQGVALGLPQYNNRQVRTRFQHYLDTSECMMWIFNDTLLSKAGEEPQIIFDEYWRENSSKEIYSQIILHSMDRKDFEPIDGLDDVLTNLEKEIEENSSDLRHPRLILYGENERINFSTGRRKAVEKYSTKIAASLAFAKLYEDIRNKSFSKTQMKKVKELAKNIDFIKLEDKNYLKLEAKHVEKSRVRDFVGLRVGFKDEDSTMTYLKGFDEWSRNGFKVLLEKHQTAKGPKFWDEQVEKNFDHFYQNKGNGYENYHLDIRSQQYKSTVIEFQAAPFMWILNNEGNPKIAHKGYKQDVINAVENLPAPYYQYFLDAKERVLEFVNTKPYDCKF